MTRAGSILFVGWLMAFVCGCRTQLPPAELTQRFDRIIAPATTRHPRQSEGDIVQLKDGMLLAAWSDFGGRADESKGNISAATSFDGGLSWGRPLVLQENDAKMNIMSASFLRLHSGEILFFYLRKNSLSDLKLLVRRSSDEARTWSASTIVTPEPGYHIMNNARAVQLKSGRILCPISFCEDIGKRGYHLQSVMFFSDDNGQTWKQSDGMVDCPGRGAMEPGVVELKNHDVMQILRTDQGEIWKSLSHDKGATWTKAVPTGIVSPESPATVARMPGSGDLLLVYNPSTNAGIRGMTARTPLVSSVSNDNGKTWSSAKLIEADPNFSYAYTSITFVRNRALLTYYYSPNRTEFLSFKFSSIPLSWFREK